MEQTQELDLKRYVRLLQKRRYLFALTAAAIMTVAVIVTYRMEPVYEAKTVVSIEQNLFNNVIKGLGNVQSGDDRLKALSTNMKGRSLVLTVMNTLGYRTSGMTDIQLDGLIKGIQDRTQIKIQFNQVNRKDIDYFVVSFQDVNPVRARDYVNSLVALYIEETLSSQREGSFGANRFLLDQITQFREKVGKLDAQIGALKNNPNIIFYDRISELQKKLDDLLIQYTDSYPEVIRVRAELEALKLKFRRAQAGGSERSTASLAAAAPLKNKLIALEDERNTNKKMYEELIAASGRSEVSAQAEIQDKTGTFKVVDPAMTPGKPISPNRMKFLLLGVIAGIGGAFFLIIVLDLIDQSIKDAESLKPFGVPVLTVIPHIASENDAIRARKKDRYFYGLSGLFAVLMMTIILRELFA